MSEQPHQGPPPGYAPPGYPPQGQSVCDACTNPADVHEYGNLFFIVHPGMQQPQYHPPPPQMTSQQQSTVTVVTQPGMVRTGGCPYCGVGFARQEYTILGILIALLFFPLGIICCLMMQESRCSSCGRRL